MSVCKAMHCLLLVWLLTISSPAWSQIGTYQTLDSFLEESFETQPESQTLWLNDTIREQLSKILDRNFRGLRIRYWRLGNRTSWILNEIGKERPITMGITIEDDKIMAISVLEYRESRGGEVKLPSFRQQFLDGTLTEKNKLSNRIDGISGATMSVKTMNRSAVAALTLHRVANQQLLEMSAR